MENFTRMNGEKQSIQPNQHYASKISLLGLIEEKDNECIQPTLPESGLLTKIKH